MKKKILSILLIGILIIGLTGCGNSKNKTTNDNVLENSTNENTNKGREISKIYDFDLNGQSAVEFSDYSYTVIDTNGKEIYTGSKIEHIALLSNGYLTYNSYIDGYKLHSVNESYVMDLTGKKVLESTDTNEKIKRYGAVSVSGYVVVYEEADGLNGKTYNYKIIDLKGNTIYDGGEDKIFYLGGDYFCLNLNDGIYGTLVNAKTKKTTELDLSAENVYMYYSNKDNFGILRAEEIKTIDNNMNFGIEVSPIVLSYEDGYLISSDGNNIIDKNGKVIRDLSEGGYKDITYNNKEFAVISETGYYYKVDTNNNYVVEPVKIETNDSSVLINNDLYIIKGQELKKYNSKSNSYESVVTINAPSDKNDKAVLKNIKSNNIIEIGYYYNGKTNNLPNERIYVDLKTNKIIDSL